MHAFKCACDVNGIMYYMSTALQIRIPPLLHKQREMKGNFCRCNKEYVCVNSMPAVFCTQCLMDPRLILVGSFVPV